MNKTPLLPLFINLWRSGLITQRSPLFTPISQQGLNVIQRYDALTDGLNMELSNTNTLIRRPAYTQFCSNVLGSTDYPLNYSSFTNLKGTINLLVDLPSGVYVFNGTTLNLLYAKTTTSQTAFQKVASNLYFCDGTSANKWVGGAVNFLQYTESFDVSSWSLTTGVTVTPNVATNPLGGNNADRLSYDGSGTTGALRINQIAAMGYAPTSAQQVTASIYLKTESGTASVVLYYGGAAVICNVTTTWQRFSVTGPGIGSPVYLSLFSLSGVNTPFTIDVWGAQLEASASATPYEAVLGARPNGPYSVSNWGIAAPATTSTISLSAGSLTTSVGWRYVYVYKNSTTGHISSASPISPSTLAFTNQQVTLSGARSADSQVDKIDIYRTKDGGSVYYYLSEVANPGSGTWSFTDVNTDTALNTQLIAPFLNTPPPTGISNVVSHMGYLFASVNNYVYFSGGAQITNGVAEECFPSANVFTFPGKVTAMLSTSSALIVFTADDAFQVIGTDFTNFYPQTWQKNFGVKSQNCLAQDGDLFYVLTSRGQLFEFSSTLSDIGALIADKLAAMAPANCYLALHRSGTDSGLFLSDGSSNVYRYGINTQSWSPVAQPVGGVKAIASIETSPSVWTLLAGRAAGSGYILGRNTASWTDAGGTYPCYATVGPVVIAAPGSVATVDSIVLETSAVGSGATVSVLPAELTGTFTPLPNPVPDPPQLAASTTIISNRYDLKAATTPIPQVMKMIQVKVAFASENARNEVLGVSVKNFN